jgi:hypothetical protein
MDTPNKKEFLLVLVACFACLVLMSVKHEVGDYGVETDFYSFYAPTAQALERGEIVIDDYHPPLYGWLIGLCTLTRIFPDGFAAALFISGLSFLSILFAVYLIAKERFPEDSRIALIAAVLTASNPTLLEHACRANVHIFFLALSLFSIYYSMRNQPLLTGLFVALAIWTRYTWILSVIPLAFLRKKSVLPGWSVAAAAWLALGLITYQVKGEWFYELNKMNFAAGLYNTEYPSNMGYWIGQHKAQFEHMSFLQILLFSPPTAVVSIWMHFTEFSGKLLTSLMVFPTGFVALFGLRRRFWTDYDNPLLFWTVASFGLLTLSFWAPQFAVNFVPLLAVAAAVQLVHLPELKLSKWVLQVAVLGTATVGIISLFAIIDRGPVDVKQAALYLKKLPGLKVAARDPRVFFYSHKEPGGVTLLDGNRFKLSADYVMSSGFELMSNDTLGLLLDTKEFAQNSKVTKFGRASVYERSDPDTAVPASPAVHAQLTSSQASLPVPRVAAEAP